MPVHFIFEIRKEVTIEYYFFPNAGSVESLLKKDTEVIMVIDILTYKGLQLFVSL